MEKTAGEILERSIRRSSKSISELAKRMDVSRGSFYYWFAQKKLDPTVLVKIGKLIDHDFAEDFPGLGAKKTYGKSEDGAGIPICAEAMHWKSKYLDLAQKYNHLITRQKENFEHVYSEINT